MEASSGKKVGLTFFVINVRNYILFIENFILNNPIKCKTKISEKANLKSKLTGKFLRTIYFETFLWFDHLIRFN